MELYKQLKNCFNLPNTVMTKCCVDKLAGEHNKKSTFNIFWFCGSISLLFT